MSIQSLQTVKTNPAGWANFTTNEWIEADNNDHLLQFLLQIRNTKKGSLVRFPNKVERLLEKISRSDTVKKKNSIANMASSFINSLAERLGWTRFSYMHSHKKGLGVQIPGFTTKIMRDVADFVEDKYAGFFQVTIEDYDNTKEITADNLGIPRTGDLDKYGHDDELTDLIQQTAGDPYALRKFKREDPKGYAEYMAAVKKEVRKRKRDFDRNAGTMQKARHMIRRRMLTTKDSQIDYSSNSKYRGIGRDSLDYLESLTEAQAKLVRKMMKFGPPKIKKIDDDIIYDFSMGYCYVFALALNKVFGYPIEICWLESGSLLHCYCVDKYSNNIIDIYGIRKKSEMLQGIKYSSKFLTFERANPKTIWWYVNEKKKGFFPIKRSDIRIALEIITSNPERYDVSAKEDVQEGAFGDAFKFVKKAAKKVSSYARQITQGLSDKSKKQLDKLKAHALRKKLEQNTYQTHGKQTLDKTLQVDIDTQEKDIYDDLANYWPEVNLSITNKLKSVYGIDAQVFVVDDKNILDSPVTVPPLHYIFLTPDMKDNLVVAHEYGHIVSYKYGIDDSDLELLWKRVYRELLNQYGMEELESMFSDSLSIQAKRFKSSNPDKYNAALNRSSLKIKTAKAKFDVLSAGTTGGIEIFSEIFSLYHNGLLDESRMPDKIFVEIFRKMMKKYGVNLRY